MKQYIIGVILGGAMLTAATSCEKEKFDQEVYNDFVDYFFMIENVDKNHQWNLMKSDTVTITAAGSVNQIQILTDNPYTSTKAEVAAQSIVAYNGSVTLAYTIPAVQTRLYAAGLTRTGEYLGVVPFDYGTKAVDFSKTTLQQASSRVNKPTAQTFTYGFEDSFPEPDDFDYNDVVLRISKSYTDVAFQIQLKVTLVAVGSGKQIAGAINLGGVKYDDLYSIKQVEDKRMDDGYPLMRSMIGTEETFLRGNRGEAVINLFEDAHWSLSKSRQDDGSITWMRYNTASGNREGYSATVDSVTATYIISFKNTEQAQLFTFEQIDPFILEGYNGGVWEVHTYRYKLVDVLKDIFRGNQLAYDNHISWSVSVPKADFQYPIEGMAMGTLNGGVNFGSYYTSGHSFGEWIQNQNSNTDWYLYPSSRDLVYDKARVTDIKE